MANGRRTRLIVSKTWCIEWSRGVDFLEEEVAVAVVEWRR
jgi:hypothetical protein